MWQLQECDPELITCDETLLVRRYSGEVVIDGGLRQPTPFTEFAMVCMVTPVTGKDLLLVPEGDRFRDQLMVYSNKQADALRLNDMVEREGWWQTQSVEDWGSFIVGRIMRVDTGALK